MARARDFNGSANETIVVSPKDVKGKVKDSILGKKARLWLLTINNPQNHGISLEQQEILERLKEDIASGAVATVYKGNIIKNLIMDCQSYTKYRPNETTGGIFVSWRRKEELPTGA